MWNAIRSRSTGAWSCQTEDSNLPPVAYGVDCTCEGLQDDLLVATDQGATEAPMDEVR